MEKNRDRYEKPILEKFDVVAQGSSNCAANGSAADGQCTGGGAAHGNMCAPFGGNVT